MTKYAIVLMMMLVTSTFSAINVQAFEQMPQKGDMTFMVSDPSQYGVSESDIENGEQVTFSSGAKYTKVAVDVALSSQQKPNYPMDPDYAGCPWCDSQFYTHFGPFLWYCRVCDQWFMFIPVEKPIIMDEDPDGKEGGDDPLVFGKWYYHENADAKCKNDHTFDYDNDGFPEYFCYDIVGSVFVVDFNGNGQIDNGIEMLNFHRTEYSMYSPVTYLQDNPDTCIDYNCYLWHDTNPKNWKVDEYELVPFSFDVDVVRYYDYGKKLSDNGRYVYCSGLTTNNEHFYCVKPTYWANIQ